MRKIIRLITQTIKPKTPTAYDRRMRDLIRDERAADRTWHKLAILKRAVILSYVSTIVRRDTFEDMRYNSKYDLIDFIIITGHADDCLNSFKV